MLRYRVKCESGRAMNGSYHGVLLIDPRSPDCFSSRFVTHTNLEHRYNLRHGDSDRRFITGLGRRHRLVWLTQSCAHACRQCAPHRSAHGRTPPCRRRSPRRRAHAWPPPCRPHTHRTGDSLVCSRKPASQQAAPTCTASSLPTRSASSRPAHRRRPCGVWRRMRRWTREVTSRVNRKCDV